MAAAFVKGSHWEQLRGSRLVRGWYKIWALAMQVCTPREDSSTPLLDNFISFVLQKRL